MEFNGVIREDCRKLLECVTKKKVGEDKLNTVITSLKDCFDYITEHEVKKSIAGLHHKFIIHAEYEKGRQFQSLVDKFIELSKPKGLTHPTWSVLHLLFKLSYRPTDNYMQDYLITEEVRETEDERIDWKTYLLEGEETDLAFGPTILSDIEDEITESETIKVQEEKTQPIQSHHCIKIFPKNWEVSTSPEIQLQDNYWDTHRTDIWTEYQVLHELLWALQSKHGTSLLFELSNHSRIRVRQVETSTLSVLSLVEHLSSYCTLLEALKELNIYVDQLNPCSWHTLTHQAYIDGLNTILMEFYKFLAEFQSRLAEQKLTTTLTDLSRCLKHWKVTILSIYQTHMEIIKLPASHSNHIKVAHLLSVLFKATEQLYVTSYDILYPIYFRLFTSSLKPLINVIDHWLTHGQMVDHYQELMITRNESIDFQDEQFWQHSLVHKTGQDKLVFMERLMEPIILAGRSVELLCHIGQLSSFTQEFQKCPKLYNVFLQNFSQYSENSVRVIEKKSPEFPGEIQSFLQSLDNSLLRAACSSIYSSVKETSSLRSHEQSLTRVQPEVFPFLPVLERSLLEPLMTKQRLVCESLLQVLFQQFSLKIHLLLYRRCHLMQAGDLMDDFCRQLFTQMNFGEEWRSETYLTLLLLNSLSSRLSEECRSISMTLNSGSKELWGLSQLQINYVVPCPVNMVINKEMIRMYNSVFRFLLRIKEALVSLQRLSFKEMSSMDQPNKEDEVLSVPVRKHRLQLLRAWLLHFVGSLHYYIMESVLESAHSHFDMALESSIHLGQIIEEHAKYVQLVYNQCLQQSTAAFLRDAINEVLEISLKVTSAWRKGISSSMLCQLEESYVRHHQFVASILGTDAARSMLPHVETLAAALIHSCPATDKF